MQTGSSNKFDRYDRRVSIGGLCWAFTCEAFVTQYIAQASAQGYNFVREDISLLGVTVCGPLLDPMTHDTVTACSPYHVFLNAGFIVMGLAIAVGALLTRSCWPTWKGVTGLVLVTIAALGAVISGLSPMNVSLERHLFGALLFFPLSSLGIVFLGLSIFSKKPVLAYFSLICGLVGFFGFFLYGNFQVAGIPRGILERIAAYPSTIWFTIVGLTLWRNNSHAGSPS